MNSRGTLHSGFDLKFWGWEAQILGWGNFLLEEGNPGLSLTSI